MHNFKKYFKIPTTPDQLYIALTNEATARLWTGDICHIDPQVGGEFSLWDDAIIGKFLELVPDQKIVQEWYFGEDNDNPSIVTIKFHEDKKGTSMEVSQTNIPDEAYEDMLEGWEDPLVASLIEFYSEDEF